MKALLAAAVSLCLLAGAVTPAYADQRDHDRREWRGDERRHDERRIERSDHRRSHVDDRYAQRRYYVGRYVAPRGYHVHSWHRGERLPPSYYSSRYVVRDYHAYHLSVPPRGHYWVRVDNDVLLTAVATGAVIAVVSGSFH